MRYLFLLINLSIILAACGSRITPTPIATLAPTATPRPTPTATPIPNCLPISSTPTWIAPDTFDHYPDAIQNYLNNGG
ncbi:MAG TPA: hypothetical protein VFF70_10980, partial [Anaerolineae bacterium]|nr:hypothetical protein [Anaerolineae bacterium]